MRRLTARTVAGLFASVRAAPVKVGFLVFLVLLLTVVTQIGGAALLLSIPAFTWAGRRLGNHGRAMRAGVCAILFAVAYLGVSVVTIPLAGALGRVPLSCGLTGDAPYGPRTIWTCLLNRHYATLPARRALQKISVGLTESGIAYLDAGFPFFDWFPLIPHLSHRDGRKIDLTFIYADSSSTPSPIGYWGFVQPRPGDPLPCAGREGLFRWDLAWLQPLFPAVELDEPRTANLLRALIRSPDVKRIFIEPHLRRRLGVDHAKMRFQGCRAARHDDHIHVEFAAN